MNSVHDNEIISYEVNLKTHRITMHTQYHCSTSIENIDILFSDVLAHFFHKELSGSIILDIEKYGPIHFIESKIDLLNEYKNSCWPTNYDTLEALKAKLLEEQYSYYVISASYGLSGWVLAKNYDTEIVK